MSRMVFLSHAGIDAYAAKQLKQRIEQAVSESHGIRVWFDKDDLQAGHSWQSQLEQAIAASSAFVVFVGATGVVNWVEAEVRLALSRAVKDASYRIVPVLASGGPSLALLPGFLQQFECVRNVDSEPDQFRKLIHALLGEQPGHIERPLETEPFFGLSAIGEERSQLFFGREKETRALADVVALNALTLVVGDSGSGKSSLVHAGLVPRFLGGALENAMDDRRAEKIWHVVSMRPRSRPLEELGDAVAFAARRLGRGDAEVEALALSAISTEPGQARRALRCHLPPAGTHVLLVIDQFEELFTQGTQAGRDAFIAHLLRLIDPEDLRLRVVATMRNDYFNLCSPYTALSDQINAHGRRGRFLLGRMRDEDLRQIVSGPLQLAGIGVQERETLASEVLSDMGQRAGDLALVQMALTETWQARQRHAGSLVAAYTAIGRVEGAIAVAAEMVREQLLDDAQRELLENILVRLVRLGDTGGAVRCIAYRREFTPQAWALIALLSDKKHKRLLLVGGEEDSATVEIAHEALVTAWPWLQNYLQSVAEDKRTLDWLMSKCAQWENRSASGDAAGFLATGSEKEIFQQLLARRPGWLSAAEREFVELSSAEEHRLREERESDVARRRRAERVARGALIVATLVLASLSTFAFYLRSQALDTKEAAVLAAQRERQFRIAVQAEQVHENRPDAGLLMIGRLGLESQGGVVWQGLMQLLHETPSLSRIYWDADIAALSSDGGLAATCKSQSIDVFREPMHERVEHHALEPGHECKAVAFSSDATDLVVLEAMNVEDRLARLRAEIEQRRKGIRTGATDTDEPQQRARLRSLRTNQSVSLQGLRSLALSIRSISVGEWLLAGDGECRIYSLAGQGDYTACPDKGWLVDTPAGELQLLLRADDGDSAILRGMSSGTVRRINPLPREFDGDRVQRLLAGDFLVAGPTWPSPSSSPLCFTSTVDSATQCVAVGALPVGVFDQRHVLALGPDGLEIWDPKQAAILGTVGDMTFNLQGSEAGMQFMTSGPVSGRQEYAFKDIGKVRLASSWASPDRIVMAARAPRLVAYGPKPSMQMLYVFDQVSPAETALAPLTAKPLRIALSEQGSRLAYLTPEYTVMERDIATARDSLLGATEGNVLDVFYTRADTVAAVHAKGANVEITSLAGGKSRHIAAFHCPGLSREENAVKRSGNGEADQISVHCKDIHAFLVMTIRTRPGGVEADGYYLHKEDNNSYRCQHCLEGRPSADAMEYRETTMLAGAELDVFRLDDLVCRVSGRQEHCRPGRKRPEVSLGSVTTLPHMRELVIDSAGPSARIFSLVDGKLLAQLPAKPTDGVFGLPMVARSGRTLLLSSLKGIAVFHDAVPDDADDGFALAWVPVRTRIDIALSGDGRWIAFAGEGFFSVLDLDTRSLASAACKLVGRSMNTTELAEYGPPLSATDAVPCAAPTVMF